MEACILCLSQEHLTHRDRTAKELDTRLGHQRVSSSPSPPAVVLLVDVEALTGPVAYATQRVLTTHSSLKAICLKTDLAVGAVGRGCIPRSGRERGASGGPGLTQGLPSGYVLWMTPSNSFQGVHSLRVELVHSTPLEGLSHEYEIQVLHPLGTSSRHW